MGVAIRAQQTPAKMPLTLRLKAWWHGYDPDDVKKRITSRRRAGNSDANTDKISKESVFDEGPAIDPELPVDPWDEDKIDIAQYVWGQGFCGPGGPAYIVAMSKLLALNPEMSMFQLGANLGGAARVLAEKFGVWLEGYEHSHALVEAGNEMSFKAGMSKKVSLQYYDPENFEGFGRKYDRGLVKETLFTVEHKQELIEEIAENLKPGGLILVTDYVLSSDAVTGRERYKQWKVGEKENPYPVLSSELVAMFKQAGLQVRVSEDISQTYVEMINKAWTGADEVAERLQNEEGGHKLIKVLMNELEFWSRRKKMLESGDLRLWRLVANKKATGVSMMSDW